MRHYADSSFLVSCYLADAHTPQAQAHLTTARVPLVFTALHRLETQNAFRLGVFRGLFTNLQANAAWLNLEADLKFGRLVCRDIKWQAAFRAANRLSEKHSSVIGVRSLDILHIATAFSIGANEILSFDARQRALAAAVGLNVSP